MILSCQEITKSFGTNVILKNVSFHIEEREKAALVGANGTGKSTLMKIISGEMACDSGLTILSKDKTLGYLAQHQDMDGDSTIYDILLEVKRPVMEMEERLRQMEQEMNQVSGSQLQQLMDSYHRLSSRFELENGYAYKSEVTGILKGLGFEEEEFQKEIKTLSGGQKTRVALGKLLLMKPDVLLLDEPTNHLDISSIQWLETFLLHYQGAVLIVSHDRYFLDRIVTKVFELEQGNLAVYSGNYSDYAKKRAQVRESKIKAWMNQQQEIKHQKEVIEKLRSFNREKSIRRAESREKMLEKMDVLEKPQEYQEEMRLVLEPSIQSGNDVLTVEDLSKSWPGMPLFSHLSFSIKRGERVAVIGANGTGKTTILKILNGLTPPDGGTIHLGSNVHIGYYDQEHNVLDMEKTVFDEISDAFPSLTGTRIRNVLAAFLFTGDDVFQQIKTLSGGERGRVSLAKLMLSNANFLILDEPTNHLDIVSKEILEQALNQYTGTVLYVSHDRYFINQTATRIMELVNESLVNYIGNYDYYLEKKEELTARYTAASLENVQMKAPTETKLSWQQQKEEQALRRKKENQLKKLEEEISSLETQISEIDELLSQPDIATDAARCAELAEEQNKLQEKLEERFEQWEITAEESEEL
ncbi:MAG: ABC-F family ATP-binding cassette domain-containing protein [Ruminococcus sp.]|jgi:ATP-binding cassette subfamily F protein 3